MSISNRRRRPVRAFAVGLVAAITAGLIIGCGPHATAEQMQTLKDAKAAYKDQQYEYAIRLATKVVDDAPPSATRWDARLTRGLAHAQLGRPDEARQDLTTCAEDPEGNDRWKAHSALGTLAFGSHDWENAERHYVAALAEMPGGAARADEASDWEKLIGPLEEAVSPKPPPVDAVLYRVVCAKERQGKWDSARAECARIVREFPKSPFAEFAQRRLDARPDHFAIQCGEYNEPGVAEKAAVALRNLGFEAYTRPEERGHRTLHVVLVGRYARFEDAEAALANVRWQVAGAEVWP
ncbi:MAG: SPOR domain-containing protein [Phycisphaerales bacterium]|nr:SPOR domain-containing protein [Phycisphaerales bacterium]